MADLPPPDNGASYSWLSPAEQAQHTGLGADKRRCDWLLGRWTAKRLLQTVIEQAMGEYPPLCAFVIERMRNGAPRLNLEWAHPAWLNALSFSISHSGDRAFCAAVENPPGQALTLGADMEQCPVTPELAAQLERDYITAEEAALVRRAPAHLRARLVTALWSAKEAALKALEVGLTVDTRAVSCRIQPLEAPPQVWTRFDLSWDRHLLTVDRSALPEQGWWRMLDDYVLTLVAVQTMIN